MRNRVIWATVIILIAWLAVVAEVHADGIIIPIPPPHVPHERVADLAIRYHRVQVTIKDQVATTEIDQVFVNEQPYEVEGIYMFPLPEGAAISDFAMYVDGEKVTGMLLDKEEARRIYEDTVRRQRDPALLEYVGRNAFRARIFPIPAKGERRVVLRYNEVLRAEGGLIRYLYPLDTERFSSKPIEDVSIHIDIHSSKPIKAIYSPSHDIAVNRKDDYHAEVGFEEQGVKPDRDFELYYSLAEGDFGLDLLSYKEQDEDGFFLLLVTPQVARTAEEIVAKDVLIVLDISGSMRGAKLQQAKDALKYILDNLHEQDRFNVVAFSTGTRRFASSLQTVDQRDEARRFVDGLEAAGGTNINRALLEALSMLDAKRPQILIFLTDGLATEGVVETDRIIANVAEAAPPSARIFTFGIGDEVNTILLDTIAQEHRGASAYVRPHQSIQQEIAAFYAKVGTPLLADLQLDFGDIMVEEIFPDPLPDLFAGSQLVLVGRYRQGGQTSVVLQGVVSGRQERFVYQNVRFNKEGGELFISRLWATRKIGYLLNQIRLHGEDKELVDEIVALSVRYGIMTPYTAFLVDESEDVLTQDGRERAAQKLHEEAVKAAPTVSGPVAVERSIGQSALQESRIVATPQVEEVKHVADRTFIRRDGVWIDTTYDPAKVKTHRIRFGSDAYFALLQAHPEWGKYLAVGQQVIVVLGGQAYEILADGGEEAALATPTATPILARTPTPTLRTVGAVTPSPSAASIWQRLWRWLKAWFE